LGGYGCLAVDGNIATVCYGDEFFIPTGYLFRYLESGFPRLYRTYRQRALLSHAIVPNHLFVSVRAVTCRSAIISDPGAPFITGDLNLFRQYSNTHLTTDGDRLIGCSGSLLGVYDNLYILTRRTIRCHDITCLAFADELSHPLNSHT